MHYVYVIKGKQSKRIYIGQTEDLLKRIKQHNKKQSTFTRFDQWRLIYYEAYLSKIDALKRERMLKNFGSSLAHLKKRIKHSLLIVMV